MPAHRHLYLVLFFLTGWVFLLVLPAHAATSIPFTVNMSEAVNVTGTPRIAVDVGGVPRYATYTSGTGTSTLTFTYAATVGDLDLDGVTLSSPVDLNGGTMKDLNGNDAALTFTVPNTSGVKVSYPSLSMDFVADSDGQYTLNGTTYSTLPSFLTAAGGTFTRASTATYYDSTGTLQTAASGTARFDYDPVTHAAKGILLEEARTNLITYSDFSSTWAGSNGATLSAAPTNMMGLPAKRITSVAGVYGGIMRKNISAVGGTHTMSVYLRKVDWSYIGFRISNAAINAGLIPFVNLDTLATSANGVAGITISAQSVGGGVVRAIITNTAGAGTLFDVVMTTSAGNESGPGSVKSVDVVGAQLEAGSFETSYIPTGASTVTRSIDSLIIPTGTWYNQNAGGFYNNIFWVSSSGSNYPMFFRMDDATNNNRWNLYYTQSNSRIAVDSFVGGVNQYYSYTASSTSGSAKVAGAQALNNTNAAFNGVIGTLDTGWTPVPATRLLLDGTTANKWHSQLKYYPLRIADSQLSLLTQ